jgi:hypothetical protein
MRETAKLVNTAITKIKHRFGKIHTEQKEDLFNAFYKAKSLNLQRNVIGDTENAFKSESFEQIGNILNEKKVVYDLVKEKIQKQVERTRTEESSPKNTTLYFSILLETKDLITATMNLLQQYHDEHDSSVTPATIEQPKEE